MGKTDTGAATHKKQSMILVPMDSPGVTVVRALTVFGYDHAPGREMAAGSSLVELLTIEVNEVVCCRFIFKK